MGNSDSGLLDCANKLSRLIVDGDEIGVRAAKEINKLLLHCSDLNFLGLLRNPLGNDGLPNHLEVFHLALHVTLLSSLTAESVMQEQQPRLCISTHSTRAGSFEQ